MKAPKPLFITIYLKINCIKITLVIYDYLAKNKVVIGSLVLTTTNYQNKIMMMVKHWFIFSLTLVVEQT